MENSGGLFWFILGVGILLLFALILLKKAAIWFGVLLKKLVPALIGVTALVLVVKGWPEASKMKTAIEKGDVKVIANAPNGDMRIIDPTAPPERREIIFPPLSEYGSSRKGASVGVTSKDSGDVLDMGNRPTESLPVLNMGNRSQIQDDSVIHMGDRPESGVTIPSIQQGEQIYVEPNSNRVVIAPPVK